MNVDMMKGGRRVDRNHDLLDALRRGDPTAPDELMRRYRRRALARPRSAHRARLFLRKRLACRS